MSHEDNIQKKIYDIDIVVKEIREFPQTYNTILQQCSHNGTYQVILRRKLLNLCRDGTVCKAVVPGTRFGMAIYFTIPKDYHIIIEAARTGSNVYCFFEYERLDKFFIEAKDCWMLMRDHWAKCRAARKFFEGNVLRWL